MIAKLHLHDERTGTHRQYDLDTLSLRREGKPMAVTIGARGSRIETLWPGVEKDHFQLEWVQNSSAWALSCNGPAGTVTVNGVPLRAGERRTLSVANCTITCQDLDFRFERVAAPPTYEGAACREIPITEEGLVIGRGAVNREGVTTPRLGLDPEIRSISSLQATVTRVNGEVHLKNHNERGMHRTKLNGDQGFVERRLVFGDCIQIPDYDYYTFQFNGLSLVHVGEVSAIQARGLGRHGRGVKILSEADLDLECGEFVGVLGGSGQGKSTLMKAVCGIVPADEGEVWIAGERIEDPSQVAAMSIGYVPQEDVVHRELTVRQALRYGARLRVRLPESQLEEAIDTVLRTLSLTEHQEKPVRRLSGGQCKRVSIASELIMNPRFLFLDEPTSGLDPQTESELMTELSLLARNKRMGILCTSHVLQNSHLFREVVWIHGGRIIYLGKPAGAVRYFLVDKQNPDRRGDPARSSGSARSSGPPSTASGSTEAISEDELLSKLPKVYGEVAQLVHSRVEQLQADTEGKVDRRELNVQVAGELADAFLSSEQRPHLLPLPAPSDERKPRFNNMPRPGSLRVLLILIARQWAILRADRLNFLSLLAQAIVIGALVGWVSDNLVFQMFLAVVATLWFGCANGAQQIVGELPIFWRERLAGVGLNAYILSKLTFQTAITAIQSLLLFLTVLGTHHLFHPATLATATKPDSAADRRVYADLFFAKQPQFDHRPDPDAATPGAGGAFNPNDFVVEDETGYRPPTNETRTYTHHPTGLFRDDREFAILERVAWFFRLRENVLDELGVKMETLPLGTEEPKTEPRSWIAFVARLLALRLGALLAAAACGVSLGLFISAAVRTPTQSVMWVPLVLIPQILFGGFVVTAPEMDNPVLWFSSILPSFNLQRLMDSANLYGRATPQMTNKTKIPAFLADPPYEKDTVPYRDQSGEELAKYDKISEVSKSWQNLIVRRPVLGQRPVVPDKDTVETRRDVYFPQGLVYKMNRPAELSWTIISAWIGGCYFLVLINLRAKQAAT